MITKQLIIKLNFLLMSLFKALLLLTQFYAIFCQFDANPVMEKTCCRMDFQMLVLTGMDRCFAINAMKFSEEPHEVCRYEIFGERGPSNDARIKICDVDQFKHKWVDCIERTVKQLAIELKPAYMDNEKLKALPDEKLQCYTEVMNRVACN